MISLADYLELKSNATDAELVAVAFGIKKEEVELLPYDDYEKKIASLKKELSKMESAPIFLDKYKKIDFLKLELGAFVNLISIEEATFENSIIKVIGSTYRQYKKGEFNEKIEPYNEFNATDRGNELSKKITYNEARQLYIDWVSYRDEFIQKRRGIFPEPETEEEDEEESRKERAERLEKEALNKKYSWPLFIYNLAGARVADIDIILLMPHIRAFNIAGMIKELNIKV